VDQVITQAGVHWLLSCVFLRFIEDNELVERPWLGGTPESGRLALARDRHEAYFRDRPLESDRDYLLASFREAGALPGLHTFFDEAHNPVFRLGISGDAAMALRQFWQQVDPNTGSLVHDFTDADWNTRFLGDLYQDLSEATRKRYALLQTPEFVEEFILDRTLTPAIREFGFREVRMIDPTCGSGHFLLGGFHRLVDEWRRHEPARNPRDIAQRALDAVAGVDLNPFAVAISRFRLLVAALKVSGVHRLTEAPDFKLNVAIGDSLLHGKRFGMTATEGMFEGAEHYAGTGLAHAYASEDLAEVQRILGRQYHAVVGNPPYIVVKDTALNAAYRLRYASCHMKYSLGAPFTERFFDLALTGNGKAAGFVGLITANSFMKREFGSKLIEQVLPRLDLTHVVDTSGAYIPGHGTPTVILFGRHRAPVGEAVRTVMGIKGEPSTPDDPARGVVWTAIVEQIDRAGSESEFVSVVDMPRETFATHPWSMGGGGASELLEHLNESAVARLESVIEVIGRTTHTGEDNVFFVPPDWTHRNGLSTVAVGLVEGEWIRDFHLEAKLQSLFPYDLVTCQVLNALPPSLEQHFWTYRRTLKERRDFGNFIEDRGLRWYEHSMFFPERFKTRLGIAFAFVATHNHFVLDRGGQVFKQTAPVVKLPAGSSEDEHLGLVGLLNSSVACFWLKQVCFNKGMGEQPWADRYEHDSRKVSEFPIVQRRPVELARALDSLAREIEACLPAGRLRLAADCLAPLPTRQSLDELRERVFGLRCQAIALQEELDWACYGLYSLLPDDADAVRCVGEPPAVRLGERAFEIVLARRIAAGREQHRLVRAPRLDARHRIPEPLARGLPPGRAAAHRPDRERPQHRLDRAPGIQAPLERRPSGRFWNRPPCATGCWPGWKPPQKWPLADQPPNLSSTNNRWPTRCAPTRTSCRWPSSTPATPTSTRRQTRRRAGGQRIRTLPARAALHRHRPAQARPVGRHLGAATPRRRRREQSARFPCRPSTRARTS
jgi:hypothetical protein